ncbi:MAG: thioesterase family protein [Novosphingobium sp.]|uniref:thioesterase family protein n=1 Tax=Novosphingobium sp. TaxID=1874826 RepID=UPI0030168303
MPPADGPDLVETAPSEADMGLGALAARLVPLGEGRFRLDGAEGWMQGRTMYGGAAASIAYAAAIKAFPGLPPLRAAQVGFVAPVGEHLEAEAVMLRQGRSVSQIETSLYCEGTLVQRTLWLFGAGRTSNGSITAARDEGLTSPEDSPNLGKNEMAPAFTARMDLRRADLPGGSPPGTIRRWVRFKDRSGLDPVSELVGIGDALPPGSARAMERQGPISSITWALTILGDVPPTREGWWLLETRSNHMGEGFSSETLRLWNSEGVEVMRGLQSVAVFG